MNDDATNEPINVCERCGKEVIGYVNNPNSDFYCDECLKKGNCYD